MENYLLTTEWKRDIPECLRKISRVSADFQQIIETRYSVRGTEEIYRIFLGQLKAEVYWLERLLNALIEEGGDQ